MMTPTALAHTVNNTAKILDLSPTSVWKMIREGELRSIKVLNRRLVPDSELQRIVAEAA